MTTPFLIKGAPKIVRGTVDLEEDFIQMPLIGVPSTPSLQASGELLAELVAPAPDRFVADQHSPRGVISSTSRKLTPKRK